MISIPKDKLSQAQDFLTNLGFHQQHERIFHLVRPDGAFQYQVVLGLEEADPATLEVNLSALERPIRPGNQGGTRLQDVRVVPLDELPESLQDLIAKMEDELEQW